MEAFAANVRVAPMQIESPALDVIVAFGNEYSVIETGDEDAVMPDALLTVTVYDPVECTVTLCVEAPVDHW